MNDNNALRIKAFACDPLLSIDKWAKLLADANHSDAETVIRLITHAVVHLENPKLDNEDKPIPVSIPKTPDLKVQHYIENYWNSEWDGTNNASEIARLATLARLKLPDELQQFVKDYAHPAPDLDSDPDFHQFKATDPRVDKVAMVLYRLDNGDGTAKEGWDGKKVIEESFPLMADRTLTDALRVFRHVLYPKTSK